MKRFVGRVEGARFRCWPAPERYWQCQLLWRGYLVNRDDILREAKQRQARLRDGSDAELMALAYRWWGETTASRLLGEYALAIYDEPTSSLFLTNDSFGLLPLFYSVSTPGLVFGSHLEDMVAVTGVGELDEDFIADYVSSSFHPPERTPYRAIRRLNFGHSATWTGHKFRVVRTWRPDGAAAATVSNREYEEQFLSLLNDAVMGALQGDGPVWSELSGGLDSSSVVCVGSRSGRRSFEAISLVYDRYAQADESSWMRSVLAQYQIPWHVIDGDAVLPFAELPDRFCGEPGLPMIDWSYRRRYQALIDQHGVAAVLTGQGGDLVFFGAGTEPYYLADLARRLELARLWTQLRCWQSADRRQRSMLHWAVNYVLQPLFGTMRKPPRRAGWRPDTSPWIDADYAHRMALDERGGRQLSGDYDTIDQRWCFDELVRLCGRVANLNQVPQRFEFRHPLLYRPLVEFMFALPPDQKFNPHADRFLQRRALEGILPEPLRQRREKTIFDQPFYEGLRNGKAWTSALTSAPRVIERRIVDREQWPEEVARARLGHTHSLAQFQAIATLEIWLQQLETLVTSGPVPLVLDEHDRLAEHAAPRKGDTNER
jgi:asparagine synthase (glutamine-hydrolysing)